LIYGFHSALIPNIDL